MKRKNKQNPWRLPDLKEIRIYGIMRKHSIPFLLFLLILLIVSACYYDSKEALYPSLPGSCDTTNVTFSGTVVPLLSSKCWSCHSNTTAASSGNNIRLQDYADVKARNVAVSGSIKHQQGFSKMPKNGGKLSDCNIRQFDIWVAAGMLDN